MKMKSLSGVWLVLCVGLLALPGCDGCSCGGRKHKPVEATGEAALPTPPVSAAALARSDDSLAFMAAPASLMPSTVVWFAAFDPANLMKVLDRVAHAAPKLTRGADIAAVQARILDIYGVNIGSLKGPCIYAQLSTGGRLLTCAGVDKVVVPVDASIWSVNDFSGPCVMRRGTRVSLGVIDGRFIAGDENAVYMAASLYASRQPALDKLLARKTGIYRELSADNRWEQTALFFPAPSDKGWCKPETCQGTALFGGQDRFLAVSIASSPDAAERLKADMQIAWQRLVGIPFEAARVDPRIPAQLLAPGDMSIQDHSFSVRSDRAILDAAGDLLDVLAVVMMDDIDWLLGL
ncbi:MAG TPA: hypothetical protein PLZ31_05480 [Myxococcota bacterium]|nr:hypothetical protein [Myxococcota bacterium]